MALHETTGEFLWGAHPDLEENPGPQSVKAGGVDVVAWKRFGDRRVGSLIVLTQCACGNNWPICRTNYEGSVQPEPVWEGLEPGRLTDRQPPPAVGKPQPNHVAGSGRQVSAGEGAGRAIGGQVARPLTLAANLIPPDVVVHDRSQHTRPLQHPVMPSSPGHRGR